MANPWDSDAVVAQPWEQDQIISAAIPPTPGPGVQNPVAANPNRYVPRGLSDKRIVRGTGMTTDQLNQQPVMGGPVLPLGVGAIAPLEMIGRTALGAGAGYGAQKGLEAAHFPAPLPEIGGQLAGFGAGLARIPGGGETGSAIRESGIPKWWTSFKEGLSGKSPEASPEKPPSKQELAYQHFEESTGKKPETAAQKATAEFNWNQLVKFGPKGPPPPVEGTNTRSAAGRGSVPKTSGPAQTSTIPLPAPQPVPGTAGPAGLVSSPASSGPAPTQTFVGASGTIPGEIAPPAPKVAAPAQADPALDGIAMGMGGKPFSKLDPKAQATVRELAAKTGITPPLPEHETLNYIGEETQAKIDNITRQMREEGITADKLKELRAKGDWKTLDDIAKRAWDKGKQLGDVPQEHTGYKTFGPGGRRMKPGMRSSLDYIIDNLSK